jgi:hypothetical protein
MKKLMTLVGVAAAGGLVYANNQRGRQLTLDDLVLTVRELLGSAKQRAIEVKDRSEKRMVHDVASKVADATKH